METAMATIPTCNANPNKQIQHTTIIDAPVQDVWKALIDVHDWSWNKWTRLDCTESPEKGLTGKLRACYEGNDQDWQTFDFEFADVVHEKLLAWQGSVLGGCLFHGYHTMSIEACADDDEKKTKLVHTEVFGGLLPMIHLGLPYAKLDRNYRLMNEALKKHVEKKTRNSDGSCFFKRKANLQHPPQHLLGDEKRSTAGTNEIDIVEDEEAKSEDSIDRLIHETEESARRRELEADLQDLLGEESERSQSNHRARMAQPDESRPLLDSAPSESYGSEVSEKLRLVNWWIRNIKDCSGSLNLNHQNIGPEGAIAIANALKDNKIIQTLILGGNNIGDEGAIAIANALKDNNTITGLSLNENNIGVEGAVAVANALKGNNTITWLQIQSNNIGEEGAVAVADALKDNNTITELQIQFNSIGEEGAVAVADALKDNNTITELQIQSNNIGDEGAIALASALKDNKVLSRLEIQSNCIGAEGAIALANALKDNTAITRLNLKDNYIGEGIGDEGAIALANALKDNTALNMLFLESNGIGDEGAIAIANALKDNTTLKWLDLRENEIGGEGASALASVLKHNETLTTLNVTCNLNIESLHSRNETEELQRLDSNAEKELSTKRKSPRFKEIDRSKLRCARPRKTPQRKPTKTARPQLDLESTTAGKGSKIEDETSSSNTNKEPNTLTDAPSVEERTISESISKEATKLRGTELFKQQCHFSLAKHRLAAMHLASLQFWIFTIPTALIAMASGTMAFLATAGIFEERTDNILNVFVGCFSFLVVFLQTLSSQLKYDTRAEMHESTAIDLRDLREDLENIENQTFVMVGHRVNEDKLNAMKKKNKGNGDGSVDETDGNGNKTNGNNEEDSLNQIFDGIQKRYNQCLKSCKSTIPLPINTAFSQLDSRINSTLSIVGHNQLERVYGYGYNNVIYFQACDELALHFSSAFLWPLRLVNPREAVVTTMKNLRTTISEDGKNYWTVLLEKDDATENADSSSSSDGCW